MTDREIMNLLQKDWDKLYAIEKSCTTTPHSYLRDVMGDLKEIIVSLCDKGMQQ